MSRTRGFQDGEAISLRGGARDEEVGGAVERRQVVVGQVAHKRHRQRVLHRECLEHLARRPVARHHQMHRPLAVERERLVGLPRLLRERLEAAHGAFFGGEALHHEQHAHVRVRTIPASL